jgi:hypothetical protein
MIYISCILKKYDISTVLTAVLRPAPLLAVEWRAAALILQCFAFCRLDPESGVGASDRKNSTREGIIKKMSRGGGRVSM